MSNIYLALMVGDLDENPFGEDWVEKPYLGSLLPTGTTITLGGDNAVWIKVVSHFVELAGEKEIIQCKFTESTELSLMNDEAERAALWTMLQSDGWTKE